MSPDYVGKEHWMDMLQGLMWENEECFAIFSTIRTGREQHPEYIYYQKDVGTKAMIQLNYYNTYKGIYIETAPKVYYKVLYIAFEQDYVIMELFNIANPMTFYSWKGKPKQE